MQAPSEPADSSHARAPSMSFPETAEVDELSASSLVRSITKSPVYELKLAQHQTKWDSQSRQETSQR